MARKVAESCRNCGAELAPGSAFCTLCGTAVANRAASPAPDSVPLAGPAARAAGHPATDGAPPPARAVPGIISIGAGPSGAGLSGAGLSGPLVEPVQVGGDARVAAARELLAGGAGRRLVAKIVDGVLPAALVVAALSVGTALLSVKVSNGYRTIDFTWLGILAGAASVLSLAYGLWLWFWEAKTGKTPGNVMLGLRTTNMDGMPAGVLAIFLRNLIVALGSVAFYVGMAVVVISNAWDRNGHWQGWHDKVANTLVFNVKGGRNPLETGGIAGREAYTPAAMPAIAQVPSPMPEVPARQFASQPFGTQPAGTQQDSGPITAVPLSGFAPPAAPAPAAGFADEAGETRVRPAPGSAGLFLTFDDGRTEVIRSVALVGRNPAGYDGEMIEHLVSVPDSGRSVSKTHLHIRVAGEGLWVTDRNSTNGSFIINTAGQKSTLQGGTPALAEVGATVHFGDRSFQVGGA